MRLLRSTSVAWAWLAAIALAGSACASSSGPFVWVESYTPRSPSSEPGVIGAGDMLDIRVLGQDQLSVRVPVRSDGFITMPFLNDIEARGLTPSALSLQIEERLTEYVRSPVVTVGVEKAPPPPVSVLGEVNRPGKYDWAPGMGVLDILAQVGGLTEYAHKDQLYVLRGRPNTVRIRFDVREVMRGDGPAFAFTLQPGDVIVAE